MRTLLRCFAVLSFLFACSHGQAQDTLFLKTGKYLTGRVEEIGLDEVKYRTTTDGSSIVQVVDKVNLLRIKLANGQTITVEEDPMGIGFTTKEMARTHAIKIDFISPAAGHLTFAYEQVLKPWMNAELKLGFIGMGVSDLDADYSGMLVKLGMKFLTKPNYVMRGMKMSHPLRGNYIKPEVIFNTYSRTEHYDSYYTGDRATSTYGNLAFNLVFGRQSVLAQGRVCLDLSVGIGYGGQWNDQETASQEYETYTFSHFYLGHDFPVVLSGGFTLGYVF